MNHPGVINYPFKQNSWFEDNSEQSRQHHYVHIDTQLWYYMPIGLASMFSEAGVLSLSTQLKRVPKDKNVNAMDLNALGQYIIDEHDEYYNSPGGANYDQTKNIQDDVRKAWGKSLSEEEILAKAADRTPEISYPPIPRHQIEKINGRDWVFCVESKTNSYTHDNMFCLPLNESYYLCLNFRRRVDLKDKYRHWKNHANAAEKKIMDMVEIETVGPKLLETAIEDTHN